MTLAANPKPAASRAITAVYIHLILTMFYSTDHTSNMVAAECDSLIAGRNESRNPFSARNISTSSTTSPHKRVSITFCLLRGSQMSDFENELLGLAEDDPSRSRKKKGHSGGDRKVKSKAM